MSIKRPFAFIGLQTSVYCLASTVMFVYLLSLSLSLQCFKRKSSLGLLSQHMAHLQPPSLTQTVSGVLHTHIFMHILYIPVSHPAYPRNIQIWVEWDCWKIL